MTEQHKPGENNLPAKDHGNEKLEREPLIQVEQEGARTVLTVDLDGIAAEADSALVKGFEALRNNAEYDAQAALLEFMSNCHARMQASGLSDAELARRMEVTRGYVSRIFNVPPNLTVVSLAKIARALGGKIRIVMEFSEHEK
jgi:hypothetical protein